MKYFDDYIDADGTLHVDARKPQPKKVKEVNLLVKFSKSDKAKIPEEIASESKMVLHHVNMPSDE